MTKLIKNLGSFNMPILLAMSFFLTAQHPSKNQKEINALDIMCGKEKCFDECSRGVKKYSFDKSKPVCKKKKCSFVAEKYDAYTKTFSKQEIIDLAREGYLSFSVIKPDAVSDRKIGSINAMIESAGLSIIGQKMIFPTKGQMEDLYKDHKGKSFFADNLDFVTSGPCVVQVIFGKNAVNRYRDVAGGLGQKNTIRGKFGSLNPANAIHKSESSADAEREIMIFFDAKELFLSKIQKSSEENKDVNK